MRYKNFDIEDFVKDDKFREWVLRPHPEINYFWEKWLLKNPEKETIVNVAREILLAVNFRKDEIKPRNKRKLWERIEQCNQSFDQLKKPQKKGSIKPLYPYDFKRFGQRKRMGRIAFGSIAASIMLFILIFNLQKRRQEQIKTDSEVKIVVKSNPSGQKSELRLPDGSMVYLNAGSSLRYMEYFQEDKRHIFLQGEAFFEVVPDTLRPFTVFTKNLATTALGTSFDIQAFDDEPQIKVALITGKVIVQDTVTKDNLSLAPGEGVILKDPTAKMIKNNIDIEKTLFWKNQTIYFENTDFQEAIHYLERWYGVQFVVKNYSGQAPLTCSGMYKNQSLENVLNALGFALRFDYKIDKKKINIVFHSK